MNIRNIRIPIKSAPARYPVLCSQGGSSTRSAIIKKKIDAYKTKLKTEKIGIVTEVGDGIASIYGMDEAMAGELVLFPKGIYGMILDLDEHTVGAVVFGNDKFIKEVKESLNKIRNYELNEYITRAKARAKLILR